jgi:hypothetical protein
VQHVASLVSAVLAPPSSRLKPAFCFSFPHPPLPCPRCLSDPRSLHYFRYLKVAGFNYILVLHPSSRGPGSWYLDLLSLRLRGCPPALAAHLGSLSCTGLGPLSGLPPKKLSASIKHTFSFVLANTTKTAARQQTQSLGFKGGFPVRLVYTSCLDITPLVPLDKGTEGLSG